MPARGNEGQRGANISLEFRCRIWLRFWPTRSQRGANISLELRCRIWPRFRPTRSQRGANISLVLRRRLRFWPTRSQRGANISLELLWSFNAAAGVVSSGATAAAAGVAPVGVLATSFANSAGGVVCESTPSAATVDADGGWAIDEVRNRDIARWRRCDLRVTRAAASTA